jgi:Tol biopolymer transport system component
MSLNDNKLYKFGKFRLDADEKLLHDGKSNISLSPKVFEMLLLFVESDAKLISKDDLIEKIWDGSFVEESNITFTIRQLRKILDDDARAPKYIQTIAKRGYRFIAQVEKLEVSINQEVAINSSLSKERISPSFYQKYKYVVVALIISLISATVVFAYYLANQKSNSYGFLAKPFNLEKITASGNANTCAISPDGKFVVYANETNEKTSLWRKQLETGESVQIIPPSENDYGEIYISKDNQTLYFARFQQNPKKIDLLRVSVIGGVPTKLVDDTQGVFGISRDEKMISFVRCPNKPDDKCSLYTADINGEYEKKLVTKLSPNVITDSDFSPDGNSIAFAHGHSENASKEFSLSKIDLQTNEIKDIARNAFFHIRRLELLPDGGRFLASGRVESSGYSRIWLIDEKGVVEPLSKDSSNYLSLSFDGDAEKLVATQVSGNFNLFISATDNPNFSNPLTEAAEGVTYSPSGKLIYASNSGGNQNIWEINADGTGQRQLTNSQKNSRPYVSLDGNHIFYSSNKSGSDHIWRMNADGSNQIQITKTQGGYPLGLSSDGKLLYYQAAVLDNLWKVSIENGIEREVFAERTFRFAVSPDATKVAKIDGNVPNRKLKIYSLANLEVENEFAVDLEGSFFVPAWSNNGKFIVYILLKNGNYEIWKQEFMENSPTKIAELVDGLAADIAISPDGKNIAIIRGKWDHDSVLINGIK